jgi:hypothetical protein
MNTVWYFTFVVLSVVFAIATGAARSAPLILICIALATTFTLLAIVNRLNKMGDGDYDFITKQEKLVWATMVIPFVALIITVILTHI